MKVYVVEGGIGKHVMFSSLISELSRDEQITIMSSYPDVFEGNPGVYRSLSRVSPYQWEDLMMRDDTELFFHEPYYDLQYIKGEKHLIQAWCDGLGIEYRELMLPKIYFNQDIMREAANFKNQNGKYIIIQLTGSQSPFHHKQDEPFYNNGAIKDYPQSSSQALINLIREKYPDLTIINFALPNEGIPLENVLMLQTHYMVVAALLESAETFIGIDSSLSHFAGALKKKGIVLWGATNPKTLGYDFHTHITNKCKMNNQHCNKPYVRELGDYMGSGQRWKCPDPKCIDITPDVIVDKLVTIIEGKDDNSD